MRKKLLLLLSMISFCVMSTNVKSQTVINGTIEYRDGKPAQSANVFLLESKDSSLFQGAVSDSLGKYSFDSVKNGEYIILGMFTGMNKVFSQKFEIAQNKKEIDIGILYLNDSNKELKAVTVTAKKPMFEQKIDRMVINVKNSITSTGGTALDVLEKSPGVSLNRQNNTIALNGKSGVAVMLNGKRTYMAMDAIVQLLDATSANNIEKIELITTPPSKYDAEGNAGYINIVLINNPYTGFNGSYFLTMGYGDRELGAAGINFNCKSARTNLYGNYSFKYDHILQPSNGFVQYEKAGNIITNDFFSDRNAKRTVQNINIGIDYKLDSSTIISALIGGYISRWSMISNNGTTISTNNVADTIIKTFNTEINEWRNLMTNLNLQHTFKGGSILYFDANYIYYKDNNPNTYSNNYYDNKMQFLNHEDLRGDKVTPINFRVFSTDYTTSLSKKITIEAGAKISLSKFTNNIGVSKLTNEIWIPDTNLSANYLLKENIGAAYTSVSINLSNKTSVKAGLRYEYTTSNLGTTKTANIVNRKYGKLFPTFYISQKLNNDNSISFSYNRRITRPAFTDLAPFTIFFDPKTFATGNPALQPALANTVKGSYNLKNYSLSLSYTQENNTIENFYFQPQRLDTITNILYLSSSNFKSEQYFNVSLSLPFIITRWWNMQNNISYNWRNVNTIYNKLPVQFKNSNYNFNSTQHLLLPANFSLEITGFYSSANYFGTVKFKPLYQLNAGLQKKFSNKKDILQFTANDVFNSGSNYQMIDKLSINGTTVQRNFNFRLAAYKLTYTRNFGNRNLASKRERATGAEDELNRVHN